MLTVSAVSGLIGRSGWTAAGTPFSEKDRQLSARPNTTPKSNRSRRLFLHPDTAGTHCTTARGQRGTTQADRTSRRPDIRHEEARHPRAPRSVRKSISFACSSSVQRPPVQQRTPRSPSNVARSRGAAGTARGVAAQGRLRENTSAVRLLQRLVRQLCVGSEIQLSRFVIAGCAKELGTKAVRCFAGPLTTRRLNAFIAGPAPSVGRGSPLRCPEKPTGRRVDRLVAMC